MASHYSQLGFRFKDKEEWIQLLEACYAEADIRKLPRGRAALYRFGDGLTYCFPIDDEGERRDYDLHFASDQVNDLQFMGCLESDTEELSGLFRFQLDLVTTDGDAIPEVPVNLYLPLGGLLADCRPGAWCKAQIACITEQITCYRSEDEFRQALADGAIHFAQESFLPVGTYGTLEDQDANQSPHAILSGRVRAARRLINQQSKKAFDHLQVESMGIKYDVLVDPSMYGALPEPGTTIQGTFWLNALAWYGADRWEELVS